MQLHKPIWLPMRLLQVLSIMLVSLNLSCCVNPSVPVSINDEHVYLIKGSPLDPNSFQNYAVEENFLTTGSTDMTYDDINVMIDAASLSGDPFVLIQLSAWQDFDAEIAKLCSQQTCTYNDFKKFMHEFTTKIHKHFVGKAGH